MKRTTTMLALALAIACGGGGGSGGGPQIVPEFQLADVNPTSPTFNTLVSPRDFAGLISAWYFGHAT